MSLKRLTINSLAGYVSEISRLSVEWSDTQNGEVKLWCRGQSNAEWGLVPGEYRLPEMNVEEIASEFQLKARPLLHSAPQSKWEWYFIMQHYGLPTRLLDWTSGALLALYFALRADAGENDAGVWVLDPWALNQRSAKKPELILSTEPVARAYLNSRFGTNRRGRFPVAVVPPYNSERITVQRGSFTVHGTDRRGLEHIYTDRLAKITVPKGAAIQLKRELRASGIGEFTVLPDLDGVCREICPVEGEGG